MLYTSHQLLLTQRLTSEYLTLCDQENSSPEGVVPNYTMCLKHETVLTFYHDCAKCRLTFKILLSEQLYFNILKVCNRLYLASYKSVTHDCTKEI